MKSMFNLSIAWQIGDGLSTNFWFVTWIPRKRLCGYVPIVSHPGLKVADFIQGGTWNLERLLVTLPLDLVQEITTIPSLLCQNQTN